MWKDSETEIDFLDFDYLINTVSNIIKNDDLSPATVGVYGDWGSGKSSLINMSITKLKEEKDTESIYFNGWLFEDYEDAKVALLGNILDTIKDNRKLNEKAKKCIDGLYKSIDKMKLVKKSIQFGSSLFLDGGSSFLVKTFLSKIMNKDEDTDKVLDKNWLENMKSELNDKELRDDIKKFRENFEELLNRTEIERLVVFIDELDRCSPDTILETLEAIRLFLYVDKTAFIIGADERHISYAVQTKFKEIKGIKIDIGKEYLEKIIQYPVRIPRLSNSEVEIYIALLFMQKDLNKDEFEGVLDFIKNKKKENFFTFKLNYGLLKEHNEEIADGVKESLEVSKQLSSVLAKGLNGNPRHCKRFLNAMVMRLNMAKYKNIELDRRILAKIMMIEYFKPRMFSELIGSELDVAGSILELRRFENDELENLDIFKSWQDDDWIKNWITMEPLIGDVDLRPYFYFSRTSYDKQYNIETTKLGKEAEVVLKNLMSGTEYGLNTAIDNVVNVNDYEANVIIEYLFNIIQQSSDIPNQYFKALLDWGVKKEEVHTTIISALESISGSKIKAQHIPRVISFGKEANKIDKIYDILDKWAEENKELAKLIESERKG